MLITEFDRLQDTPDSMTLPHFTGKIVGKNTAVTVNYERHAKTLHGQCVFCVLESTMLSHHVCAR
jgi:hypothetical protein